MARSIDDPEASLSSFQLPNLIIGGVNKAATTSLFTYLSQHPNICPGKVKEPGYFLHLRYNDPLPPIEKYYSVFEYCTNTKYIMEATAGYFYGGAKVATGIRTKLPNVRLIFLLRNPISRLFSFYKFKKGTLELEQDLTFEEYVRLCENLPIEERKEKKNNVFWGVEGGYYDLYLEDWFRVFGENAVRIIFFEHLIKDPIPVLAELCNWLEIEYQNFVRELDLSVENRSVNYRSKLLQKLALRVNVGAESFWRANPRLKRFLRKVYYAMNGQPHVGTISPAMRAYLEKLYRPHNQRLVVQLLRRGYTNFPEWLANERTEETTKAS